MTTIRNTYPLSALRALALHAQQLTTPHGQTPTPTPDAIYDVVEQIGCVQIDTLHMVARSQYLVIWSRLDSYDPVDFDRLIFEDGQRRLFEHWRKAASIIPLEHYRYQMAQMRSFEGTPGEWWERWLDDDYNRDTVDHVLGRIRREGPLRAADFKYDGPKLESWWDWKPAKHALEYLLTRGDLMISDRVHFHRVYDLRERVLPAWVDTNGVSQQEARCHYVEDAARALGVCRPLQTAEYAYIRRGVARPIVETLTEEGIFVEVEGEMADGSHATLITHRGNLHLLEQAADGALPAGRTTFLSPFDSLFWAKDRDQDLWRFQQVLEAYKRAEDRIWGYYCLPILHKDRLVGRFDPKLERKTGTLYLRALYLEPGVEPDEELITAVAGAMRDFLTFHAATDLIIEKSDPVTFGQKLLASL